MLSVVIPTIGRPEALSRTLTDLGDQERDGWECIVVAQDRASAEAADGHAVAAKGRLVVQRVNTASASRARNVGLARARGEIVLFLDDDVRISRTDFFGRHLSNYRDPDVPGVVGQVLPPSRRVRTTRHPRSRRPRVGWLYFPVNHTERCKLAAGPTANLSVRRDWALEAGGMDEQFEKGAHREDSDFTLRLVERHGPLVFDPEASLVHLGEPEGGCRSWGLNQGVHPLHHVVGEWYFILKNVLAGRILVRDLPDHLFSLARRQIVNRKNRRRPLSLLRAVGRSVLGLIAAIGKVREGPRHLQAESSGSNTWRGDAPARVEFDIGERTP